MATARKAATAPRTPEKLLASWAATNLSLDELQDCTLYTSAEPCAMCSGAIYWAGIGRVVFGQTERDLKAQTGAHEENPTLDLPCHIVFEAGQRPTEIVGPLLAEEAAANCRRISGQRISKESGRSKGVTLPVAVPVRARRTPA